MATGKSPHQILYGANPILEILKAGRRKIYEGYLLGEKNQPIDLQLASCFKDNNIPLKILDKNQLDHLSGTSHHQGVAIKSADYPYYSLDEMLALFRESALFVVCDSIQDPQNLGALCRSAHCFGINGVIINKDQSVTVTPAVVKASAGAVEHLAVTRETNLARTVCDLKKNGFWSYSAEVSPSLKSIPLDEISPSKKMVVVLGNEGRGIRRLIKEECDFHVTIPMAGSFNSLNVAQAATVFFYEISRRRKEMS